MTPEQWQEVKRLLLASLDLPPDERSGFLSRACAENPEMLEEVRSLLVSAGDAELLETRPLDQTQEPSGGSGAAPGTRIGPYRIEEEVGRGGMGAVYRAVRDDGEFEQEVAVKLVKRGMDTDFLLERFRYERQILAFLSHPNICRMLDGGSTPEDCPYFVMEYVQGLWITEFCARHSLDLTARLQLFLRVCPAVEHAHRNLVVHRDLKPGNILVTADGEPKLLDFGIAKLVFPDAPDGLAPRTADMQLLTPDYASPEQVRGERITTATDVYSLGAVLYEMLTGAKAHRFQTRSPLEVERVVCQIDPQKPSAVVAEAPPHPSLSARYLQGDLDRIVLKALHKEPARRYSSVEQLSEDLRRYLAGLPVSAAGDSVGYRTSKFVRRHKTALAAAAAVVVSLLTGLVATTWQAHVAKLERDRAERRFNDVRSLANSFLVEHDTLGALPGGTAVRSALIQRSLEYLDSLASEAGSDRELQRELATAYEKMGDVQGMAGGPNLGDTAGALESYRKALAIRETLAAAEPGSVQARRDLAAVYAGLSGALKVAGDYHGGLDYDRKALAVRESLLREEPGNREYQRLVASSYTTLGASLSQFGDWDGVLEARRKALAMYEKLAAGENAGAEDRNGLSLANMRMGNILMLNKEMESAFRHYRRAVEVSSEGVVAFPRNLQLRATAAGAITALGRAYQEVGRWDAALKHYRNALHIYSELSFADPQDARTRSLLATVHYRMGYALLDKQAASQAIEQFRLALGIREELARQNPLNAGARGEVAESCASLGDACLALGRRRQAFEWYERARELLTGLEREGRMNHASKVELERVVAQIARLSGKPAP